MGVEGKDKAKALDCKSECDDAADDEDEAAN